MTIAPPGLNAFDFSNIDIPGSLHGDILFKGALGWTFLPAGSFGDFLRSAGPGADPAFVALPGGGDMLVAIYDPSGVVGNAFDLANFDIAGGSLGDIYIRDALGWKRLPGPAGSGFVLTNSPASEPAWLAPAGNMQVAVYDPTVVAADAFDLANFRITAEAPGDLYTRGPANWERLSAGAVGNLLQIDAVTGRPVWDLVPLLAGYISGLGLSVPTVATVDIAIGRARADDDSVNIVVVAPITITMPADLDTGAEAADTFYDVFVTRTSGGVVGGLFVVRGAVPTVAAGTTVRRIGTVRNDSGSDFIAYLQTGGGSERTYLYLSSLTSRQLLTAGTATAPTAIDCSSLVPNTTQFAIIGARNNSATRVVSLFQDVTGAELYLLDLEESASIQFPLNASQQLAYENDAGAGDFDLGVRGYVEVI